MSPSTIGRVPRGFCHQEAPQAHGEEEAPQAAEEDAHPASPRRPLSLTLFVRQGCHLCDDAIVVAREVCGPGFACVDVDTDPALRERYGDHVPVAVVDGRVVSRWFLEPDALRRALGL